jgi:hypothetical protein
MVHQKNYVRARRHNAVVCVTAMHVGVQADTWTGALAIVLVPGCMCEFHEIMHTHRFLLLFYSWSHICVTVDPGRPLQWPMAWKVEKVQ